MKPTRRILAALALPLVLLACDEVEKIRDQFRDRTPHEAYLAALADAGLYETALVRDWIAAARTAVDGAPLVQLPFQEEGYIASDEAGAVAYRIRIGRGQRLEASVSVTSQEDTRVFVDLFRVPDDSTDAFRPVLAVDTVPGDFRYEPWRGGEFVLRVQPELLRGGRYRVVLRLEAQLAFPVEGVNERAIMSGWGADREGGRRSHEGVDIFASRGTPVLAAADGMIRRVEVTRLGGKVVWLRDSARNASLYFAHLDSQAVRAGQEVRTGDVLGFVGNTGNARTTPPHLHFGIYRRGEGAVDPAPFLRHPPGSLDEMTAEVDRLGSWVRSEDEGMRVRSAPGVGATVVRELGQATPLRVLGAAGSWFRVRLPDGTLGYVAARLTESLDAPIGATAGSGDGAIRHGPAAESPVVARLEGGPSLPVLGRFGAWAYVTAPGGRRGWIAQDPPS